MLEVASLGDDLHVLLAGEAPAQREALALLRAVVDHEGAVLLPGAVEDGLQSQSLVAVTMLADVRVGVAAVVGHTAEHIAGLQTESAYPLVEISAHHLGQGLGSAHLTQEGENGDPTVGAGMHQRAVVVAESC